MKLEDKAVKLVAFRDRIADMKSEIMRESELLGIGKSVDLLVDANIFEPLNIAMALILDCQEKLRRKQPYFGISLHEVLSDMRHDLRQWHPKNGSQVDVREIGRFLDSAYCDGSHELENACRRNAYTYLSQAFAYRSPDGQDLGEDADDGWRYHFEPQSSDLQWTAFETKISFSQALKGVWMCVFNVLRHENGDLFDGVGEFLADCQSKIDDVDSLMPMDSGGVITVGDMDGLWGMQVIVQKNQKVTYVFTEALSTVIAGDFASPNP